MSLLRVKNVSHGFGDRQILKDANFTLNKGEHIGLIGANGEGKSTFINIIMGKLTPDDGKIEWAKRLKIGYLDQYTSLSKGKTIKEVLEEAFEDMFKIEEEIMQTYNKMADCTDDEMQELLDDVGEMQNVLDAGGFYLIDTKINDIASGLGLLDIGLDKDVTELSGGQRSKVLLTKLLLQNPSILVLDEPTNFLDEEHIRWLRNFLINYENAFIIISHDVDFINSVINIVYHLEQGNMTRYSGNYGQFLQMYEMKKQQLNSKYEAQQRQIKELEDFVARNKARVATRGMANSRQKMLDKMELIEKVKDKVKPNFIFKYSKTPGKVLFEAKNLVIGYDEPLSKPINLEIVRGEKVTIKGVNGIGKSTLLKSLIGLQKPFSGETISNNTVDLGYFEQEAKSSKNTALDEVWNEFPSMLNAEVRGALAACGLTSNHIESLMMALSGGENAKVRLCKLMLLETNCLILDEPTNHLDVLAKQSLKEALQAYKGSVIVVSHEPDFYDGLVDRIINLEEFSLKII